MDLRQQPPRRWSVSLDGIIWLPRLIDKTRAAWAGTLGGYLYGQSPMDAMLLRALGVGYRKFAEIVREAPDDEAILAALREYDPAGLDRARAWSVDAPRRYRLWYLALDFDDGYIGAPWVRRALNAVSNAAMALVKRVWPSRATEPSR